MTAQAFPPQLTADLRFILGMMCFELGSFAHAYRDAGEFIGADGPLRSRAEDEQAFMLHRFLTFWFEHGDDWRKAANEDLERVRAIARARREARR